MFSLKTRFRKTRRSAFYLLLLVGLAACGRTTATLPPAAVVTSQPQPMATADVTATDTAVPSPTATVLPTFTPVPPTPTLLPTPSPTPDPYADLTIEALASRSYGGGELNIIDEEELDEGATYRRYLITYPSDGLTIYGFANVPIEGSKFPVAIVLHGYIDPAEYDIVDYTARYANNLAEAGYFVIHPNFRNYPPSDSGPDPFRIGYAIDVLNLIAIIREQSQDPLGYLRRADADNIHLWGHSMGGGVALRVIAVNNEPYIKAAVLYGSMSGDEALNYGRIQQWTNGSRGDFELSAPPETLRAISPIYHLDRIQAAIAVHHSRTDDVVPVAWSEQLCQLLQALAHPAECYFYDDLPHTFRGPGDTLFMQRVVSFFNDY
ncbi:MAG TPA: alpha/beta fold hydrolase [Anaerolineae bacterium]